MAIDLDFGIFDVPASTGVTSGLVSGLSFQPQALIFWGVPVSDESVAVHAAEWWGMTDGTTEFSIMVADENALSDTRRDVGTTQVLAILNAASDTRLAVATFSSFQTDGFELNFSVVQSGLKVHWLALGGLTNVACGSVLASGSPVTGLGFQPDAIFAFTAGLALSGTPSQHAIQGVGWTTGAANEWWKANYNSDNNTDNKDSMIYTDAFVGQQYNGSRTWQANLTSFDTGGFTWGGSNADGFYYLAMETGGAIEAYNTTKPTSAAPATHTLPTAGFTPGAIMLMGGSNVDETINTPNGCASSVGITDGVAAQHIFRTSPNNTNNSDQRQDNNTLLMAGKGGDAVPDSTAQPVAITDTSPDITWDPNSANADIIGVVYFDVTAVAGPSFVPHRRHQTTTRM